MYIFSKESVKKAVDGVCSKLGVSVDHKLADEYTNGKHPKLLMYEKLQNPVYDIPVIQKYLISCVNFLSQPCQYYDIFRACRHVVFIQFLDTALESAKYIQNHEDKYDTLRNAKSYEAFEACLFELAVAHRYYSHEPVKAVKFIEEGAKETPDLEVDLGRSKFYVECKKFNRSVDLTYLMRAKVRESLRPLMKAFLQMKESVLFELSFHVLPYHVSPHRILQCAIHSYESHSPIINEEFTIYAKRLTRQELKEYTLHPSPKYYWERYSFRERGEWFGLAQNMIVRFVDHIDNVGSKEEHASTWIDSVDWECAVKWKISDSDILARLRRIGYNRIFKGLSQLNPYSSDSTLHLWLERDYSLGHRQNEMLHFFTKIASTGKDVFSWIIFNETCLDISPKGSFDMIEHAHIISGPSAQGMPPQISNIFTTGQEKEGLGEFGIGHDLPDIDTVF